MGKIGELEQWFSPTTHQPERKPSILRVDDRRHCDCQLRLTTLLLRQSVARMERYGQGLAVSLTPTKVSDDEVDPAEVEGAARAQCQLFPSRNH